MEIILLIIVAGIIIMNGLDGYKKGMVKLILCLVALIGSMVVAALVSPAVGNALKDKTELYNKLNSAVDKKFEQAGVAANIIDSIGDAVGMESIEEIKSKFADSIELPDGIVSSIEENLVEQYGNNNDQPLSVEEVLNNVSDSVANTIWNAIIFVILFVIIYVIVSIIISVSGLINSIPLIGSINQIVGLVLGVVKGLCVVWIACLVLTMFGSTEFGLKVFDAINANALLSFIYSNNILLNILT